MAVFDELGFRVRAALPWSLPAFKRVVRWETIVEELDPGGRRRAEALHHTFDLSGWSRCCSAQEWKESLYALDVYERHLAPRPAPGRALEVGAKNGSMIPALATFTSGGCDAVELDAHRRYLWGSTRRAYGEALASAFPDCRFIAGDVRTLEGPWSLVTWWLPFLSEAPLRAWGLPPRFLEPRALLEHLTRRVAPGGVLFVVNQGEGEAELQAALFRELGLEAERLGPIVSELSPFRLPRFAMRWRAR